LLLLKAWSAPGQDVTFDRLLQAEKDPNNWLTYFRDYRGWRFSPLTQINTTNVKRVVPKWTFDLEGAGLQLTPLVIDGVMYVTNSNHHIFALDAATGKLLWRYRHKLPDDMPSRIWGRWNRGVAVVDGKVIAGTMDAQILALEAKTGKLLWQVKAGDYKTGEEITSPPIIAKQKALIGVAPLEFTRRGFIAAYSTETGEELWRFQTGFGADAPPVIYEVDGEQFVAIATGGNQLQGSAYGDAVWAFSLKGQLGPLWPPPPPPTVAGPIGPIASGVSTVRMGGINGEYSFVPSRVRVKKGDSLTFINVGDLPHGATAWQKGEWDTGVLPKGDQKSITFNQPGNYYYICLPHPWMYGQVIVEE